MRPHIHILYLIFFWVSLFLNVDIREFDPTNHIVIAMQFYCLIVHQRSCAQSSNKGHIRTFTWQQTMMIQTLLEITSIKILRCRNRQQEKCDGQKQSDKEKEHLSSRLLS